MKQRVTHTYRMKREHCRKNVDKKKTEKKDEKDKDETTVGEEASEESEDGEGSCHLSFETVTRPLLL